MELGDLIKLKDGCCLWHKTRWGVLVQIDGGRFRILFYSGSVGWFHRRDFILVKKCPRLLEEIG